VGEVSSSFPSIILVFPLRSFANDRALKTQAEWGGDDLCIRLAQFSPKKQNPLDVVSLLFSITRPEKHFALKFLWCLSKGCNDDDDDDDDDLQDYELGSGLLCKKISVWKTAKGSSSSHANTG